MVFGIGKLFGKGGPNLRPVVTKKEGTGHTPVEETEELKHALNGEGVPPAASHERPLSGVVIGPQGASPEKK